MYMHEGMSVSARVCVGKSSMDVSMYTDVYVK